MKDEYHGIYISPPETPDKILFLDIDGVMVTDFRPDNMDLSGWHLFNEISVNLLNSIIEVTQCHIVITSTWRKRDVNWIRDIFEARGFKYPELIIGETMRGYHFIEQGVHLPIPRGLEIKAWMDTNMGLHKCQYAIVDDDADMLLEQKSNFIQTKSEKGLTLSEAHKLIYILTTDA